METSADQTQSTGTTPVSPDADIKLQNKTSKWFIDESFFKATEAEKRTHRLSQFNEKFSELINKQVFPKYVHDVLKMER